MSKVRKALVAAGAALAGALGTAMLDGTLTGTEAVASVGVGLVAGAGVWRVKNAD